MVVIVMITIILMDTADSATSVTPLQPWLSLSCGRSLKTAQMSHHHMDLFHFITETQLVQLHVTASRLLSYMLKLSCQWAVELLKQTHTGNLPLRTDCKSCVASLESCLVNTWRIFCKHEALRPTQRLPRNRKTCGCARFVNKTAPSGWSFTLPLMSLFFYICIWNAGNSRTCKIILYLYFAVLKQTKKRCIYQNGTSNTVFIQVTSSLITVISFWWWVYDDG